MERRLRREPLSLPILPRSTLLTENYRRASASLVVHRFEPSNPDKSEVVSPPLSSSTSRTSSLHDCTSPTPSDEEVFQLQHSQEKVSSSNDKLPPIEETPPKYVKSVPIPNSFPLSDPKSRVIPSIHERIPVLSPTSEFAVSCIPQGSERQQRILRNDQNPSDPLFSTMQAPTSVTGTRKPLLSLRKRTRSAPPRAVSTKIIGQRHYQQPFCRLKSAESRPPSPNGSSDSQLQEE